MPKITGGITAAIVALLVFTGCAGTPATDSPAAPQTQVEQPAETPATEPEPLVAEAPDAPDATNDRDAAFVALVRAKLLPDTQIPNATDEQLIAAGRDACEQVADGVKLEDVRVVDGEKPYPNGIYYDTSAILNAALSAYCPEHA